MAHSNAKKRSKTTEEWAKSIPFMVCADQIEEGREKLSAARVALVEVQEALERGASQVLMVRVCDLIECAEGLETISFNVEIETDDEGISYPSLSVACEWKRAGDDETENGEEGEDRVYSESDEQRSVSEELSDWLSDIARDLYEEPMNDKVLDPKTFMDRLSKTVLGEKEGPEWLALREKSVIEKIAARAPKAPRPKTL